MPNSNLSHVYKNIFPYILSHLGRVWLKSLKNKLLFEKLHLMYQTKKISLQFRFFYVIPNIFQNICFGFIINFCQILKLNVA
jgi:hypothetical protein